MACTGGCGGKGAKRGSAWQSEPWVEATVNDRGMIPVYGNDYDCAPYSGRWTGTHVHIVGQNTAQERIFMKSARRDAVAYARANNLGVTRMVNVTRICHDQVVALLGE